MGLEYLWMSSSECGLFCILGNLSTRKKRLESLPSLLQHLVCISRELVNNYISYAYFMTISILNH